MSEKKVWEEEWEKEVGRASVLLRGIHPIGKFGNFDDPEDAARAQLAAQAPAMARLLLELLETLSNARWGRVSGIKAALRAAGVLP